MGPGHDIHFEVKVFERLVITNIKQMAAIPVGDQSTVFDLPGIGMFFGFFQPFKVFAVEELDKAIFGIGGAKRLRRGEQCGGAEGEEQISFHAAENKRLVRWCKRKEPANLV